jgi:hypothetical protein
VTHASITSFNASYSGAARWIIGGLTAGTYAVTVGGSAVSGSPFTVAAGDNSIEFSTANAGVFTLGPANLAMGTSVNGSVKAAGSVIIH